MWHFCCECARSLKRQFDKNILFWLSVGIGIYVLWFVPQVRNIWYQGPPPSPQSTRIAYWVFVVLLLLYYAGSLLFVLDSRRWLERLGSQPGWLARGLQALLWLLYGHLLEWAVSTPAPAGGPAGSPPRKLRGGLGLWGLACVAAGIAGLCFGPEGDDGRLYVLGGASIRLLSLFLFFLGVWMLIQVIHRAVQQWRAGTPWPQIAAALPIAGGSDLEPIALYQVRVLGWLIVAMLASECLWIVASHDGRIGQIMSYRLYTIWGALHLVVATMLLALLADRWNRAARFWPIRVLVLVLIVGGIWWYGGAVPVASDDFLSDCTPAQRDAWGSVNATADASGLEERSKAWFTACQARIEHIKTHSPNRGPFVLVAASGGGSRAAIFTALALETLARTPLDASAPLMEMNQLDSSVPSWADNILLISSVSGGSLAAAYYVHRGDTQATPFPELPDLRYTTKTELVHRIRNRALGGIENFVQLKPALRYPDGAFDAQGHFLLTATARDQALDEARQHWLDNGNDPNVPADDRKKYLDLLWAEKYWRELQIAQGEEDKLDAQLMDGHPELRRARWVLRSEAMDNMCLDFMAPILRGVLTPTLDRGDALARFWTDEFHWRDSTDFSGYRAPITQRNYEKNPPLLLFNASDVTEGSRLVVGFPPLPSRLWAPAGIWMDAEPNKSKPAVLPFDRPKTFAELDPAHRISLARAVRMSSNFPWGFPVMEFRAAQDKKAPLHVLDGGVVDNSGLDTIYNLFLALEWYAKKDNAAAQPFYHAKAHAILNELCQRGVVIFEIDSGAKLSRSGTSGPLAGLLEPTDALNNASFTTSQLVERFYIREIKRILTPNLDDLAHGDAEVATRLKSLNQQLRTAVQHVQFQCNHYAVPAGDAVSSSPDEDEAAKHEVMTAWALGPDDKAEVVARFLAELGSWDTSKRKEVSEDADAFHNSYLAFRRRAESLALRSILQKRIQAAHAEIMKLAQSVAKLSQDAQSGRVDRALTTQMQKDIAERKQQSQQFAAELARVDNAEPLANELRQIDQLLTQMLTALQQLQGSKGRTEMIQSAQKLTKGYSDVQSRVGALDTTLRNRPPLVVPDVLQPKAAHALQSRLDRSAVEDRQLFRMRSAK